jgi:phage terminase small subunit
MAKITEKQKAFCKALLTHSFNQTKAYQSVYKNTTPEVARASASRLLINVNVKEYLQKLKDKDGIKDLVTVEEIISGIKEVFEASVNDPDGMDKQSALKSLEMLGRYKAMFTDKTINDTTTHNTLSFEDVAGK